MGGFLTPLFPDAFTEYLVMILHHVFHVVALQLSTRSHCPTRISSPQIAGNAHRSQ